MTQPINKNDYVFVYGIEWGDELISCFQGDPEAQSIMRRFGVTIEDVRRYYLRQPHFNHIYRQLVENAADEGRDPVEMLMIAVSATKLAHERRLQ